jgi:hypothetical protein
MSTLLDRARERYGTMSEYARYAGLHEETLEKLRASLLE